MSFSKVLFLATENVVNILKSRPILNLKTCLVSTLVTSIRVTNNFEPRNFGACHLFN